MPWRRLAAVAGIAYTAPMSSLATLVLVGSIAAADPVEDCRAAHAGDSAAHIACLEAALRARVAAPPRQAAIVEPSSVAASAAPGAAAPAGPVQAPAGLGAEQVRAPRQANPESPAEQVAARIVSIRYTAGGLGVFMMADGQVWQETEQAPEHLRLQAGTEYDALIKRGAVGGYRMRIPGTRWMYKVRRLQ